MHGRPKAIKQSLQKPFKLVIYSFFKPFNIQLLQPDCFLSSASLISYSDINFSLSGTKSQNSLSMFSHSRSSPLLLATSLNLSSLACFHSKEWSAAMSYMLAK